MGFIFVMFRSRVLQKKKAADTGGLEEVVKPEHVVSPCDAPSKFEIRERLVNGSRWNCVQNKEGQRRHDTLHRNGIRQRRINELVLVSFIVLLISYYYY